MIMPVPARKVMQWSQLIQTLEKHHYSVKFSHFALFNIEENFQNYYIAHCNEFESYLKQKKKNNFMWNIFFTPNN